ncbi:MAG: hypothetical protein Q8Q07_00485 [Dehalococcoidales bacterium]|nr:hypothetical protein [Dehalococcoidales bacterium]
MAGIIDVFLVWWLRSGRYGWSKLRRKIFEQGYLKAALPAVNSLAEIQACLKQVTWTKDGPLHLFDSISYPQATWARKKDDCDGFATLACDLLKRLDASFNPALVTAMMHPVRKSHTVCVFTYPDGTLGFFDNNTLRNSCITYSQVVEKISQGSDRLVCWDVRRHDNFALLEFHRK